MEYRALLLGVAVLSACGPSYWKATMARAADLQETAVSAQAVAKDAASKQAWLMCNALTVLLAERAQTVLERRADAARGAVGADKALAEAEHAAEVVYPLTMDACALAKKVAAKLGTPPPVGSSPGIPDTSRTAPVTQPPAIAPTGGASPAVPAASLPAGPVPGSAAPPVGVPSPPVTH